MKGTREPSTSSQASGSGCTPSAVWPAEKRAGGRAHVDGWLMLHRVLASGGCPRSGSVAPRRERSTGKRMAEGRGQGAQMPSACQDWACSRAAGCRRPNTSDQVANKACQASSPRRLPAPSCTQRRRSLAPEGVGTVPLLTTAEPSSPPRTREELVRQVLPGGRVMQPAVARCLAEAAQRLIDGAPLRLLPSARRKGKGVG